MSETIGKHVYDYIFWSTADKVGAKTNRIAFDEFYKSGSITGNATCLDFSFNRNIRWHPYPSRCHAAPFQIVSFCNDQSVACQVLVRFRVKSITGGSVVVREFVISTFFWRRKTKRRVQEYDWWIGEKIATRNNNQFLSQRKMKLLPWSCSRN